MRGPKASGVCCPFMSLFDSRRAILLPRASPAEHLLPNTLLSPCCLSACGNRAHFHDKEAQGITIHNHATAEETRLVAEGVWFPWVMGII
ncbi:hypothetical protein RRG08_064695 [Elysia crispata]|uniref:Uncharacterized protein n=1 Tax=Elysia crispata TaxID=231223 RepID=A0AAE1D7C7_9GAST|nr:hypothetical protein RRG08_064695 [Elysia crispata]